MPMNPRHLPLSLRSAAGNAELELAPARSLSDNAQSAMYLVQDGLICYANPAMARLLGWPEGSLEGQAHAVVVAPEFRAHAELAIQRRLAGKTGQPGDLRCLRQDGSCLDVRVLARRVSHQARPAVLVTLLDISELKNALRRAEWSAGMMARTEALCCAGSFEVNLQSGRLRLSAGLLALLGLPEDAEQDALLDALPWVPADEQAYVAGLWRNASIDEPFEFRHRVLHADGQRRVVLHRGQLGIDKRGVALLQDVTAQVESAQRIQDLATHHEITGLPNRSWLLDQADAAIQSAHWDGRKVALLVFDLPRIAEVKASMGFGAGDTLCMALAARLQQARRDGEQVAQLADTEFAVLLAAAADSDSDSDGDGKSLRERAQLLRQQLEAPVRLGSTDVYARCLVGIAAYPNHGQTAERLLECAQTARLDVTSGAGVAFFRPESALPAMRAMRIESALWQALDRQELALHYQPQIDLDSGAICGAEALLRWHSADLGAVSPSEFIPVAERSGIIGAIGDWVLLQACHQLVAWRAEGLPAVRVAVNLAAGQLQQPDFAQRLQALLLNTGADPAYLGIELTESMVMTDVEGAAATLRAVKAIGVQVSLDDFGTGFSSLSCLSRLPIDVVKIDRSFVRDLTADAQDVSVTRTIIHMTHGLQMRVLAEGVETEGQLSLLVAAGCDEVQGFWFSRPLPAAEFATMLRAGKRLPERHVRQPGGPRRRTLLLVDDEDNILSALKRLLRRDGYHIVCARSAAEGLQRLAEEDVDVIVSDQRMPGMTGVEFLHRARDLYPHTFRLVLSGFTELQSIIDAVNQGAIYKFLTKPWDDELLRGHVADAFRQKGLADENRRLARQVDSASADLAALNDRLARTLAQQTAQAELLAASAGNLREVFDLLPIAVIGLDGDGSLNFANREAERLLPVLGGLLGLPVAGALPAALLAPMAGDAVQGLRLTLAGARFEARLQALPGNPITCGRLVLLLPCTDPERLL